MVHNDYHRMDHDAHNDKIVPQNKPEIFIKGKKRRMGYIFTWLSHAITTFLKKEAQNFLQYKTLQTETERLWDMKIRIIPIIMRAPGTIGQDCLTLRKRFE